jgi:flavorubredoxin
VDAATIVIGSPTVLTGAHPNVVYAAQGEIRIDHWLYGWGGKMVKQLVGMIPNLKVEILDPVVIQGNPRDEDFKALDKLAASIAEKHHAPNLR